MPGNQVFGLLPTSPFATDSNPGPSVYSFSSRREENMAIYFSNLSHFSSLALSAGSETLYVSVDRWQSTRKPELILNRCQQADAIFQQLCRSLTIQGFS
jgi:hypothetical protein